MKIICAENENSVVNKQKPYIKQREKLQFGCDAVSEALQISLIEPTILCYSQLLYVIVCININIYLFMVNNLKAVFPNIIK